MKSVTMAIFQYFSLYYKTSSKLQSQGCKVQISTEAYHTGAKDIPKQGQKHTADNEQWSQIIPKGPK